MAALFVTLVCLVLLGLSLLLGRGLAIDTGLSHPLKALFMAAAASVSFELVTFLTFWVDAHSSHGAMQAVGNILLAFQLPGLLVSNMLGFGFHSEGEGLRLFYILMAVVNAVTYGFILFAAYAFLSRRNRTNRSSDNSRFSITRCKAAAAQ